MCRRYSPECGSDKDLLSRQVLSTGVYLSPVELFLIADCAGCCYVFMAKCLEVVDWKALRALVFESFGVNRPLWVVPLHPSP